jgi:hypothetical protein
MEAPARYCKAPPRNGNHNSLLSTLCTVVHRFAQSLRANLIDAVYQQEYLHARLNRKRTLRLS